MTPNQDNVNSISDERRAEIAREFIELQHSMEKGGLADDHGAVSAFYTSLSVAEVVALSLPTERDGVTTQAEPVDCYCGGDSIVGHNTGCPEAQPVAVGEVTAAALAAIIRPMLWERNADKIANAVLSALQEPKP